MLLIKSLVVLMLILIWCGENFANLSPCRCLKAKAFISCANALFKKVMLWCSRLAVILSEPGLLFSDPIVSSLYVELVYVGGTSLIMIDGCVVGSLQLTSLNNLVCISFS
jgi:hypothetical protein